MNKQDFYDEEDWNEVETSISHIGDILDQLQNGKINKQVIKEYINLKSEVSSKNKPVEELLFLKKYINILSSSITSLVLERILELKKEDNLKKEDKEKLKEFDDELLGVGEIKKILKVSPPMVYKYIHSGKLKSVKVGSGRYKVYKSDLKNFIKDYRPD